MRENPIDILLRDGVIDEVLGRLNSGKEADLYIVQYRDRVVAAKVYRDREMRSFKNNADYKEGRAVRNSRTQRAIDTGSRYGRQQDEENWGTTEARALHLLHENEVRVPTPVMFYEGVLLMELVKDAAGRPAKRLIEIAHHPRDAQALYADLRTQMVRMLCCDIIHGDLSPYNILAGAEGPTIIDFPQIVSAAQNSRAEFFFLRDFENVQRFIANIDRAAMAVADDGRKIWNAYRRRELTPDFVPLSGPLRGAERDRRPLQRTGPLPQRSGPPPRTGAPAPNAPRAAMRTLPTAKPTQEGGDSEAKRSHRRRPKRHY